MVARVSSSNLLSNAVVRLSDQPDGSSDSNSAGRKVELTRNLLLFLPTDRFDLLLGVPYCFIILERLR